MTETNFFPQSQALTLRQVAEMARAALPDGVDGELLLRGVAPLENAGPGDLAYMDNPAYGAALSATRAAACLVTPRYAAKVPSHTVAIVTPQADARTRAMPSTSPPAGSRATVAASATTETSASPAPRTSDAEVVGPASGEHPHGAAADVRSSRRT